MKKTLKLLFALTLILILSSMCSKTPNFHVRVEQNGKIIKAKNRVITLDKEAFKFVFELSEPMGVLINTSFNETSYQQASKGMEMSELFGFENTGMAEAIFNPDKEILIANDAPSAWFYESEEMHRFDLVEKKKGQFWCTRIIENFFDVDADYTFPVAEIDKALYLVFIAYDQRDGINEEIELKREMVKIVWK